MLRHLDRVKRDTVKSELLVWGKYLRLRGCLPPKWTLLDYPVVENILSQLRPLSRERPACRKTPVSLESLRAVVLGLQELAQNAGPIRRFIYLRNAALFVCSFLALLRRSEVVQLTRKDFMLENGPNVVVLKIRHSKTDQQGKGVLIPFSKRVVGGIDVQAILVEYLDELC